MIVKYPTGLYRGVLPKSESDSTSVTYTISMATPPRADLLFPKAPPGILRKMEMPEGVVVSADSTQQLVFSVSSSGRSVTGSSAKQYEIGQVLEFDDVREESVEPMLVGDKTESRHDLNVYDYDSMGISDSDIGTINQKSSETYNAIMDELNRIRSARLDMEVSINAEQKVVNELTKNINALKVVYTNTGDDDIAAIIEKLESKKSESESKISEMVESANKYASDAAKLANDLRNLAVVLK